MPVVAERNLFFGQWLLITTTTVVRDELSGVGRVPVHMSKSPFLVGFLPVKLTVMLMNNIKTFVALWPKVNN